MGRPDKSCPFEWTSGQLRCAQRIGQRTMAFECLGSMFPETVSAFTYKAQKRSSGGP